MSARTLSHRKAVSNSEPQGACAPPRAALVLATPLMEPPASARGGARCTAEARAANRPSQRLQEGPQHSARGRARRARRSAPRRTQRRFRASDPAFRSVCARPEGPWGRPHTRQAAPMSPSSRRRRARRARRAQSARHPRGCVVRTATRNASFSTLTRAQIVSTTAFPPTWHLQITATRQAQCHKTSRKRHEHFSVRSSPMRT